MMEGTTLPYKHLPSETKGLKKQAKNTHHHLSKTPSVDSTIFTHEKPYELQYFRESSSESANTDCAPFDGAVKSTSSKRISRSWRKPYYTFAIGLVSMVISLLLMSVVYLWMSQQKSNIDILHDITSLKENFQHDNKEIKRNMTLMKSNLKDDNSGIIKDIAKLKSDINKGNMYIMKDVRAVKRILKQDIRDINKEIGTMKRIQKEDYCFGKSVCYPYPTCYGNNCTCAPLLPRDQKCRKAKCHTKGIQSAYSNTKNGRTYMTVGSLMYQFKHRLRTENFATVAKTWPRPSQDVLKAFSMVDELFIHSDRHTYIFSGDKYITQVTLRNQTQVLLPAKHIGRGVDQHGRNYIGWQGLKHYNYIDAALRSYGGETYLFQDDLVYLWNSTLSTSSENHFPSGAVASGWPKKISDVFPGVPNKIDTAFLYYYNHKLYFFKGQYFYTWHKLLRKAKGPHLIRDFWRNVCADYVCGNAPCRTL